MAEAGYALSNTVCPFTETADFGSFAVVSWLLVSRRKMKRQLSFFLIKHVVAPALKCNLLGMTKDYIWSNNKC